MGRMLSRIEHFLTALLIFFIPANMSLHILEESASVYGILIDYLMPKIYLSDFVIGALFLVWVLETYKHIPRLCKKIRWFSSTAFLIYLLIATVFVSAAQSQYPISGYWFLFKLLEMILLIVYLSTRFNLQNYRGILSITVLFQAVIGLIHWFQQKSILGYLFLGETTLKNSSVIAQTGVTGELRKLPYGTTPHPNVLAGFLVVGLLLLLLTQTDLLKFKFKTTVLRVLFLIPVLTTLLLTQSISAFLGLGLGIFLMVFPKVHWQHKLALVAVSITLGLMVAPTLESTSVTRRIQLAEIAINMIEADPLLGIGPNNFTARMSEFGTVSATTRFLQPVHNIVLLWISETGLISSILLVMVGASFYQILRKQGNKTTLIPWVPLMALLLIGMVDHYPLTLQTGQLLVAFSAGVGIRSLNL